MATQRVFQDRTLATKWAMTIDDGEMILTATADAAESEPIIEDAVDTGTYWKLFVDDGVFGFESTVTVQDDDVTLTDATLSIDFRLYIGEGNFYYSQSITGNAFVLKAKSTLVWELISKITNVWELKAGAG